MIKGFFEGYSVWMKWLENQLKIKSKDLSLDPQTMYEILQRRHVHVHNGGRVSPQYLTNINWLDNPPEIGAELTVDREYLESTFDELTVAGASLSYLLMRKLCPKSAVEPVDNDTVSLTYEFLRQGRWNLVEKIASIALPDMTIESYRTTVRVNRWIAQKRSVGVEAIANEVTNSDVSALQPVFELARMVLLDDPSAIPFAQELLVKGDLKDEEVERWPLFEDVRLQLRGLDQNSQPTDARNDEPSPEVPRRSPDVEAGPPAHA